MVVSQFVAFLGAIGIAGALPSQKRSTAYVLKERHEVPRSWTKLGPASKRDTVDLKIGLVQQNPGMIEQHLMQISDPKHERYGKHLSKEEIENMVAPSKESMDLVQSWLQEHGITDYVPNKSKTMIHCAVPIGKVETLLNTTYSTYKHDDGTAIIRASEWSLPEYLVEHVEVVQPTTSFFHPTKHVAPDYSDCPRMAKTLTGLSTCLKSVRAVRFVTPQCRRALYGTLDYVPQAPYQQMIATTNYLNETVIRSDVSQYMQQFRPDASNLGKEINLVSIANGDLSQMISPEKIADKHRDQEANLDIVNFASIAYPIPFTAYHTGGRAPFIPSAATPNNTNEPYLEWLDYMLALDKVPQVISSSYGDEEMTVPKSYAERVCSGFAQLSARGVTLIFSSGDNGVGQDGLCIANDGSGDKFTAVFPASCPWVTAVGATTGFNPEVASTSFMSGGGFSYYFDVPYYQKEVTQAYVKSMNGMYRGAYNDGGRGYPDVAANGQNDVVVYNGQMNTISGTSCAGPTFAGVVALVNDALIAAGRPVLGFMNPWLYSVGYQGLNDIVQGSSSGCNTKGFPAQQGWDPVTGYGTPRFKEMLELALSNPIDGSVVLPKGNDTRQSN
ncbi:hypothetical protein CERZMDRAFT_34206 [Cercospora zeae-maydis SCOH1-5]|uniref:tripeptidyl-peptidase II n=1 Tax=Cercospora zeae-maydis SCOH1-5 TaxID=717836 RepID=A0A6A6FTB3_9PEZI|nr:hypothetical protein CERZMDRAFT_34206 [Cercospora zeae-maydis SCOH1-5]